jgi:DNA sulfur modification protein DndB
MSDVNALANLLSRAELIGLARQRGRAFEVQSVKLSEIEARSLEGWSIVRKNKTRATVRRSKRHDVLLEDRVWMLLWRMGFPRLSGHGGAVLTINPEGLHKVTSQLDAVAIDDEVCVAIECKSSASRARRPNLQEEMAKLAAIHEPLARAANPPDVGQKRTPILIFWTHNAVISRNDAERAKQHNIALLGDDDLEYFEALTQHLGAAARYQFLSDLVPGKQIPGLTIRVPALRSKMGGYTCYTFSVAPEYLLKIAYVSHRLHGKGSDVATYQRMLTRARLRKIADYIETEPNAMFPTNIVINLEKGEKGKKGASARFDRAKQEPGAEGATFGWLTLRPAYKSAWIIDGQHRLFAYSYAGPAMAASSRLSVLAFEGLPGSIQQKLFIDINAEQKSVKRSLLQELFADLHRGALDPRRRVQALISEAVQDLDGDPESPFFDRILLADRVRSETRCISLTSVFSALDKPGLYFGSVKGSTVVDPGPFWATTDEAIIRRTTDVVNAWFHTIRKAVSDWWELGSGEGGGLAMNDGVTVCTNVLRSVVEHLDHGKVRLTSLTSKEVIERLSPYAEALSGYFALMTVEQRIVFRAGRGVQGQTAGTRHAQQSIQLKYPDFQPDGLAEFLEREKARTNDQAASLINRIERVLYQVVVGALKEEFGAENEVWWYAGVPEFVRTPVTTKQEKDRNQRGAKERYLDFVEYRDIIRQNWLLFGPILGEGKVGSKDKRTEWIVRVNDLRKIAMHASSAIWVSFEQIAELQQCLGWLQARVDGRGIAVDDDVEIGPVAMVEESAEDAVDG